MIQCTLYVKRCRLFLYVTENLYAILFFFFFVKMDQSWPLFVYFRYFLDTISIIQIEKSIDGVLGIRTWGRRMVGADETMELWQPPACMPFFTGR